MQLKTITLTAAFAATIPLANWMIGNVGTVCIPDGPCLLPVGFGLTAPSGVLVVGASLVLRDMVHEAGGVKAALIAIGIGGILSALFATPALLVASVLAFVLAELADLAVYAPLRERRLWLAVLLSGAAGAVVDSAVFLWLAFGSLDYLAGQTLGKLWMTLLALPVIWLTRMQRGGCSMTETRSNHGGYEPRFVIERTDGQPIPADRRYIVLSFDGSDPEAVEALRRYAALKASKNPQLAQDIVSFLANPFAAPAQHRYSGNLSPKDRAVVSADTAERSGG